MALGGFYNNSASDLLTAIKPRDNWAARSQAKREELQYGNILEARARQEAQESQAAVQGQMEFIQQVQALPLEEPDKVRVGGFVDSALNDILKNIDKNYQGNARKYFETEGVIGLSQLKNNILRSPVFLQAQSNKVEVDSIRKALADGKELVGEFAPDGKYVTAQQKLLDFQNGVTDRVRFSGAYDPSKVNAAEFFGKQYAPGGSKFVRTPVGEEEKLGYATQELGGLAGLDYYQKSLKGKKIYHKVDPIEDKKLFDLKVAGEGLDMQLTRSQINENNAQASKARADAAKKSADAAPTTSQSYFQKTLATNLGAKPVTTFNPKVASNSIIPQLGVSVGSITKSSGGKAALVFNQFENIAGDKYANAALNIVTKELGGKKTYSGALPGMVDTSGPGAYVNLQNVPHTISKSDSYIYTDGAEETNRATQGKTIPDRAWKYYEAVVTEANAKANKNIPGFSVQGKELKTLYKDKKTGNDVKGYVFKGYVPVTNYLNDPVLDQTLTKGLSGVKTANDIFDQQPTTKPPVVFDWK